MNKYSLELDQFRKSDNFFERLVGKNQLFLAHLMVMKFALNTLPKKWSEPIAEVVNKHDGKEFNLLVRFVETAINNINYVESELGRRVSSANELYHIIESQESRMQRSSWKDGDTLSLEPCYLHNFKNR